MADQFDAIIIGAGQAGGPLSTALARAGWRTALIERAHVGGTCVNEGCTPTKTMIASARVAHLARRAADYGVQTDSVQVDLATVRGRKRAIVESFRGGSQRHIESTEGVTLIFGTAHFSAPYEITVQRNDGTQQTLSAPKIFLNVGARAAIPSLEGIEDVPYLTSTSIMELDSLPEHLIILGGGYIGVEFGQTFRRFGAHVSIVQRGDQLLGREDADLAAEFADMLRGEGINIALNARATRTWQQNGALYLEVESESASMTLRGSHLLVAAGRVPNTDTLNLAAAGIQADSRGFIKVNERLETNVAGIYALGDVNGGAAFTHIAYDDFRIVRDNLLHGAARTTQDRLVPYTVFTDPQLGRVGLSEREARAKGLNIRVAKLPMAHVARAIETDETRGFMKAILDAETGQILGAAVLGIEGGEIVSVLQMAMIGRVPYTAIRDGVFAHPTLSESLNNLFMTLD
ncbi:MAG: mercuric reductase [Chloroflexi bacterium CFX4]|nr:mercuric reductase [Chloroflexi bacterium CFX4]MDL1922972.1 mercuric reductase [Chloroflexi bacterium CFX3]